MALFVVERYVPASTSPDALAALGLAGPAAPTHEIRHLRSWFLPADETCFSLFEAPSAAALKAAGDAAGVRYSRITEAIETDGGVLT
jgi:hypothetical protein